MTLFSSLRYLRHGPLRRLSPLWVFLGRIFRFVIAQSRFNFSEQHFIGSYGPFNMEAQFAFSDFASWGNRHNRGFATCIESCREEKCVFDVGAHIGLVTMPMSQAIGPEGKVYAFEPSVANRESLENHLALNNIHNVIVVNSLVGSTARDRVDFYESSSVSGMNTCAPIKNPAQYNKSHRNQITLDEFCATNSLLPSVIKIDVEGFEVSVLKGARTLLAASKPKIFLSIHPQHLVSLGSSVDELKALILDMDYNISDINGESVKIFSLDEYLLTPKK